MAALTAFLPPFFAYKGAYAASVILPMTIMAIMNAGMSYTSRIHRMTNFSIYAVYVFYWFTRFYVVPGVIEHGAFYPTFFVSLVMSLVLTDLAIVQWNDQEIDSLLQVKRIERVKEI